MLHIVQGYSPRGEEENQIDGSRVGGISPEREGAKEIMVHQILPDPSTLLATLLCPSWAEAVPELKVHWREIEKHLRKHGCISVVDHVPKSSATIFLEYQLGSNFRGLCFMACSLQEKEKKNVSSLVEAALDEESDSEDEMEVSFTKVRHVFHLMTPSIELMF